MNTKKAIIIVFVAVVIFIGAYIIFNKKSQVTTEVQNTPRQEGERQGEGRIPPNFDLPENWEDVSETERREYMQENRHERGDRPEGRTDRGE